MTLIETIKKDLLQARKDCDKITSSMLSTLVGDADRIGKDNGNRAPTDSEVQAVAVKFMKSAKQNLELTSRHEFEMEIEILERYLPKSLSDMELMSIIKEQVAQHGKNKGKVLGFLAKEYKNRYDGKQAADLFQSLTED